MKRLIVIGTLMVAPLHASPAFAECAWVLWMEQKITRTEKGGGGESREWIIRDTYATLPACREGQEWYWKKLTEDIKKRWSGAAAKVTSQPYFVGEGFSTESGYLSMMYIFNCVPDTLDPRPTR